MHVTPHAVFGRSGNDLTITVPVTFPELALGTTLDVPTLDGKVSLRVPPGTASGRVLRVRGKGIAKRDGQTGDLLVTLQVAVPAQHGRQGEDGAGGVPDGHRRARPAAGADRDAAATERVMTGIPFPPGADEDTPVFVISVAAQLSGLHAQTLRGYDRQGLVSPGRTSGGGRRYSMRDIALLREVQRLSQEQGVNLAGHQADHRAGERGRRAARPDGGADRGAGRRPRRGRTGRGGRSTARYRNELVPVRQQTALVVWKPRSR